MKLKIFNNRTYFFQYDLGQKLIVLEGEEVDELHFTNSSMNKSVVMECYTSEDGIKLCDIPNMMLTKDGIMTVYAYVIEDGEYTLQKFSFTVLSKKKPDDYVDEQDEPRWSDLEKRIRDLEVNGGIGVDESTRAQINANTEAVKNIPTKTSQLENDAGYITKAVSDLANYYTKDKTYTREEVLNLVNAITTMNVLVVEALPTEDISTKTIYLVKKTTEEDTDIYNEYIYVNSSWELIGNTAVDLTDYQKKSDETLETESKEVVGAINEVNSKLYNIYYDEEQKALVIESAGGGVES